MEFSQFEKLEEKIGQALRTIQTLKQEKKQLELELVASRDQVNLLRESLSHKDHEINSLKGQFTQNSDKMEQASQKLQDLILKLEEETSETSPTA